MFEQRDEYQCNAALGFPRVALLFQSAAGHAAREAVAHLARQRHRPHTPRARRRTGASA